MKSIFKPLLLLFWIPAALAAPGDPVITLSVPINVSKLPSVVKFVGVQCHVMDNPSGSIAVNYWANSPLYPVQNGAANVTAQVQITVPGDKVILAKGYSCQALLSDLPGSSTPAGGLGPWWSAVQPGGATQVKGYFN